MTQEEIKNYIGNNLKMDIVPLGNDKFEIMLLLEGEVISKVYYTNDE